MLQIFFQELLLKKLFFIIVISAQYHPNMSMPRNIKINFNLEIKTRIVIE